VHLVTAGAITAHKGQDLFVRIVRALRDRGRPVVGHVVGRVQPGSEAYEASVRALARELGVEAHVVFWGFAPDEDVRDLFRVADLFVLPTSEEGFGLVLAEAQACGTPVLATSIAPVDEVVRDGETGRLVPRTVEAFAEAADTLLADREGLERMGAAARSWVERTFGVESFCRNVTDVYEDVLAGGHGAAGEDRVRA
jgi:glycosyltransferase involved in cell wall biosynthesis